MPRDNNDFYSPYYFTTSNSNYFAAPDIAAPNIRSSRRENYIHSYDYAPDEFIKHSLDKDENLFLGIELEIDCGGENEEVAENIVDIMGKENVYCVHDGSLENGIEIVTMPCTMKYHRGMSYQKLFSYLVKEGYRSHDVSTCGLHIHINRDYFGEDKLHQDIGISKLLYVFEKYHEEVELIARRKHNRYARRIFMDNSKDTVFDMYSKAIDGDKYTNINLKHEDTIEFRIFKGTLNYQTFMSTLQFVRAMVRIIKQISIYNIQSVTWDYISNKFPKGLKAYYFERKELKEREEKDARLSRNNISIEYPIRQINPIRFNGDRLREVASHIQESRILRPTSPGGPYPCSAVEMSEYMRSYRGEIIDEPVYVTANRDISTRE